MKLATIGGTVVATALLAPSAVAADLNFGGVTCARIVDQETTLPIVLSGFAPNSTLSLYADGEYLSGGTADDTGAANGVIRPPSITDPNVMQQVFTFTADDGQGNTAGPVQLPVSRVAVKFPNAKPEKKVKFRFYGFLPDQTLYMFVRRGTKTKARITVGTPTGPCGQLTKKMRFLPLKRYKTGKYQYFFSYNKTFSKQTYFFRTGVVIYRTFGR